MKNTPDTQEAPVVTDSIPDTQESPEVTDTTPDTQESLEVTDTTPDAQESPQVTDTSPDTQDSSEAANTNTEEATLIKLEPELTAEEKAAIEFTQEVLRLVNEKRVEAGILELNSMDVLTELAQIRAIESSQAFSHTRPDGTKYYTIFSEYFLRYRCVGENLAYGYNTPESVVRAWMKSKSHKANILNANYKYIGIGYTKKSGKVYCSQLFYTPTMMLAQPQPMI